MRRFATSASARRRTEEFATLRRLFAAFASPQVLVAELTSWRRLLLGFAALLIVSSSLACERTAVEELPLTLGGAPSGDGKLHVTFFDVGHAEATLIVSPTGRSVLIGAGAGDSRAELAPQVSSRTRGRLDLFASWTPDSAGLQALRRAGDVSRHVIVDGWNDRSVSGVALPVVPRAVDLGGGAQLTFLGSGAIWGLTLEHGDTVIAILRPLNAEEQAAALAFPALRGATLLRAPGRAESGTLAEDLLRTISPEAVIVSVGADNDAEAPAAEILQRLGSRGAKVFRTDLDGTLELTGDGARLTLTPSRPAAGELAPTPQVFPSLDEELDEDAAASILTGKDPAGAQGEVAEATPAFRPRYLAKPGEPYFHMPDCRSVRGVKSGLRAFRTRAEAARRLKPAPDCNP